MTFVRDKAAFKTALLIFMTYGEEYRHIAECAKHTGDDYEIIN